MRITVDTNVLVRLATNDVPEEARRAATALRNAEHIAVPTLALCEMVWVLSRAYRRSREQVELAIERLRNTPRVFMDDPAVSAGLAVLRSGGDFADAVIAVEGSRLGGATFVSFDKQATKLVAEIGLDAHALS